MEPPDARSQTSVRSIGFETTDGVELVGDLSRPAEARAAAIICHPHPQYGGDRHNNVVRALFDAFPEIGVAALRFDFRREFGGGTLEILDAHAAVEELIAEVPGVPILATGYSFGAIIALALDHPGLSHRVLVAPPLGAVDLAAGSPLPTLVLTPEHDQFCPPARATTAVSGWPDVDLEVIPSADHFLLGATTKAAQRACGWVAAAISAA